MIRLFSMFSGYGGAEFALKRAGIPFTVVGFSEIDKYAIQCYNQNHYTVGYKDENIERRDYHKNYGDARKISAEDIPDFDLLTGGFPCQAFSIAGKGLGELDTRGTLFNDIIRIAEVKQPKFMLLENVKGLTSKKHKATFDKIISELRRIGYDVTWKVLNTKDYGVPQNRERVFFVCKLGKWEFNEFTWPEPFKLQTFLKDILEKNVDEKYYLTQERVEALLNSTRHTSALQDKNYSYTLASRDYKEPKCVPVLTPDRLEKRQNGRRFKEDGEPMFTLNTQDRHSVMQVGNIVDTGNFGNPQRGRIYSAEGCSPALNTMQGGGLEPKVVCHNLQQRSANRPSVQKALAEGKPAPSGSGHLSKADGTSYAIDTAATIGVSVEQQPQLRIRKLTPRECFRLMGFDHDQINLDDISNTQRYKLVGNGWDINLVALILAQMFPHHTHEQNKLRD